MNVSTVCFLNVSYLIYLPIDFSQGVFQSPTNPRILGLDENLPWDWQQYLMFLHQRDAIWRVVPQRGWPRASLDIMELL